LTGSPFTYPSASTTSIGLRPPETPGPIQATVVYTAPATASSVPAATVTVSTVFPDFLPAPPTPPSATFTLSPMVVSVGGVAKGTLSFAGANLPVTVNEAGATAFTLDVNADAKTTVTLLNANGQLVLPPVQIAADPSGSAAFIVSAVRAASPPAAPAIVISDARGTIATVPISVGAAAPAATTARRAPQR
jgi:hypothetical protein